MKREDQLEELLSVWQALPKPTSALKRKKLIKLQINPKLVNAYFRKIKGTRIKSGIDPRTL